MTLYWSGARTSFNVVRADQIQARVVAQIVVVALIWAAVAVLIGHGDGTFDATRASGLPRTSTTAR